MKKALQIIVNIIVVICMTTIIVSCNSNKSVIKADLNLALRLSGENRPELEKVLEYYSKEPKDSVKLEAAKFLISNMICHYSKGGKYMDQHIARVDSLYPALPQLLRTILYTMPFSVKRTMFMFDVKHDLLNIKADFLIDNIEKSFAMWDNHMFSTKMSKEVFFEYLLPYRICEEPLISWKDSSSMFDHFNFKQVNEKEYDLRDYVQLVKEKVCLYEYLDAEEYSNPLLTNYDIGCIEEAYQSTFVSRSLGIPCAVDFLPHYPKRDHRHYWYVTIDERYLNNTASSFPYPNAAKVYRKVFSINPMPIDKENYVPEFMRSPYNMDVTEIYQKVSDLEYKFEDVPRNVKYGYLAVFNSRAWNEVAWADMRRGKVKFEKLGREIIYLPTYYNGSVQVCAKYPLILGTDQTLKEIIPNKNVTQNLKLDRKSTVSTWAATTGEAILGLKIKATNDISSETYDSLAVISSYNLMHYDSVKINSDKKYKYWMLHNDRRSISQFGDLIFLNQKGERVNGIPFSISSEGTYIDNDENSAVMYDDDVLTHFKITNKAGLRFEEPVSIAYVKYVSRCDANGIYPGDEYELLYFDNGQWVSLGRKISTKYYVEYDNVPTEALFWLRNLTRGVEERPFTVRNGRVRFW